MRYSTFLIAAAFTGYTSAQSSSSSPGSATATATLMSVPSAQSIDPNSVSQSLRTGWCRAEYNTCMQICLNQGGNEPSVNNCEQSNLTYACACPSGPAPNITDYQQSLPGQVCREWQGQCVANHPNDLQGQATCLAVQCGNKTLAAQASASSSAAPTTSTDGSGSGSASQTSPTSSSSPSPTHGAAVALRVGETYGLGIFATAMLAIVGLAL